METSSRGYLLPTWFCWLLAFMYLINVLGNFGESHALFTAVDWIEAHAQCVQEGP